MITSAKQYKNLSTDLIDDFEGLIGNDSLSDIVLKVGDQVIKAHKNILAIRSQAFSSMIIGDKNLTEIEITDADYNTMLILIKFIYSGKVDALDLDSAMSVLIASNKYQLHVLNQKCQEIIMLKHLKIENALDILCFADSNNADVLKNFAINQIVNNFNSFNGNDFFKL